MRIYSNFVFFRDKTDCIYQLTAVLLHIGKTASAGHYIAHILDEDTKQWWKFDDLSVTPLDSKEIGDIETSFGFDERRTKEKAKAIVSGLRKNPKVTSQNAYMLIYTRKENKPLPNPIPPPETLKSVEKANSILLSKLETWKEKKTEIEKQLLEHKENYKKFMNLAAYVSNQPYHRIDVKYLTSWIIGETNDPINNKEILCPHGNVNPRNPERLKIIHSKGWDFLHQLVDGGGPALTEANLCLECAEDVFESKFNIMN